MATKTSTFPFDTLSIEKRTLLTLGYVNDIEKNHELSNTMDFLALNFSNRNRKNLVRSADEKLVVT